MQAERKNMQRMEEIVPDSNEQSLQHFLSNSPWDDRGVMDQVALDVDAEIGGHEDTMLLIDESGLPKKGEESVGVARQWCGQLGKVDNCQVAVFAALGRGERASLVDARLYLPKVWTNDKARCHKAGVPEHARAYRSKHELALDIVEHALELGLRFEWVAVDAFYGENGSLLRRWTTRVCDSWPTSIGISESFWRIRSRTRMPIAFGPMNGPNSSPHSVGDAFEHGRAPRERSR